MALTIQDIRDWLKLGDDEPDANIQRAIDTAASLAGQYLGVEPADLSANADTACLQIVGAILNNREATAPIKLEHVPFTAMDILDAEHRRLHGIIV